MPKRNGVQSHTIESIRRSTVNTMSEHDIHLLEPAPFGRILPAMVTPMKSDGSVDFEAAQQLAKRLARMDWC